jgi:hypothetical protein
VPIQQIRLPRLPVLRSYQIAAAIPAFIRCCHFGIGICIQFKHYPQIGFITQARFCTDSQAMIGRRLIDSFYHGGVVKIHHQPTGVFQSEIFVMRRAIQFETKSDLDVDWNTSVDWIWAGVAWAKLIL